MSLDEEPRDDDPNAVPLDKEEERRELEAAGWVPVQREGKAVWRHSESGHLYQQGEAMERLRMNSLGEDAPHGEPRGGA